MTSPVAPDKLKPVRASLNAYLLARQASDIFRMILQWKPFNTKWLYSKFCFIRKDCLVRTDAFFVITYKRSINSNLKLKILSISCIVQNGFHEKSQQNTTLKQNIEKESQK